MGTQNCGREEGREARGEEEIPQISGHFEQLTAGREPARKKAHSTCSTEQGRMGDTGMSAKKSHVLIMIDYNEI